MAYINESEIIEEMVVFLRNSDIFTTNERGVTTTTVTASLSNDLTYNITLGGVRNIRSVSVGGSSKSFGTDYTVAYGTSSTAPTTITFGTTQTGTLNTSVDYGNTDKIFPDFPRPDLSLSSFPRLAVDVLDSLTESGGFGNVNKSEINFTIVVYDDSAKSVRSYIDTIREKVIDAQNSFYYLKLVKPKRIGPIIKSAFEKGKDKIVQKNIDIVSPLNYEKN